MEKRSTSMQSILDEASVVLFLNAGTEETGSVPCRELTDHCVPHETNLLVATGVSPDEWWHRWQETVDVSFGETTVIGLEEIVRSSSGETSGGDASSTDGDHILEGGPSPLVSKVSLDESNDLLELGYEISYFLSIPHEGGEDSAICIDDLATILDNVPANPVFHFFYLITSMVRMSNARMHVHFNGEVSQNSVLDQLEPLFDTVIGRLEP